MHTGGIWLESQLCSTKEAICSIHFGPQGPHLSKGDFTSCAYETGVEEPFKGFKLI